MKNSIKSIVVLVCICAVVASLLAVTNYFTAPIIEKNAQKDANKALLEVYPEGGDFELMDISSYTLPSTVSEVYKASNGGYVIKLITKGYAPNMVIMCGIDASGTVVGSKYLSGSETNGGELVMNTRVPGATIDTIDGVDTVTSPTAPLTNNGYLSAIKDALNAAIILGGGSADLRTEEEIFQENLSNALPSAEGKFTKRLFVEIVEGIDAIYTADNKSGMVYIIGEQFIGVDKDGNILTECSDTDAQTVATAVAIVSATTTTDIDLSLYADIPSSVTSVKITGDGVYVIELKAKGYSAQNSYAPPDMRKPIVIHVSIAAYGKIVDCLTVSQSETEGIGSICADEKYYGQFDSKTEEECQNIDTIAGVTTTTRAYRSAILNAFKAIQIIEEVTE